MGCHIPILFLHICTTVGADSSSIKLLLKNDATAGQHTDMYVHFALFCGSQ